MDNFLRCYPGQNSIESILLLRIMFGAIPTIIFFKKNYVFIILKINTLVNAFFANQFILSIIETTNKE